MSALNPRAAAAPLLIAAAVLSGGHMLLVDPAKRQLAEARAHSAQREAHARRLQAVQSALPELAAATAQARRDAAAIERSNTPAKDPGVLFATLADLASRHRVRVDQLDPFVPRRPTAPPPRPAAAPLPTDPATTPPPEDTQLGYTMTLVATYADLAAFLDTLQTDLGYTRILSVRIAPSPEGPETVTARIQTTHHAFTLQPIALSSAEPRP